MKCFKDALVCQAGIDDVSIRLTSEISSCVTTKMTVHVSVGVANLNVKGVSDGQI